MATRTYAGVIASAVGAMAAATDSHLETAIMN